MKVPISTALSFFIFYSPILQGADYRAYADKLLTRRKSLAVSQVNVKFDLISATQMAFVNENSRLAVQSSNLMLDEATKINSLFEKYSSPDLNLDGTIYRTLVADVAKVDHHARVTRHLLSDTQAYLSQIKEIKNFPSDFCIDFSQRVDVSNLKAQPMNYAMQGVFDYTKYPTVFSSGDNVGGQWYFSGDPAIDGAALMLTGATVAGVVVWSIIEGATISSILANNAVAITVSGAAAGFVMVAVAVLAVVSAAWTTEENKKRKRKSEKKYEEELRKYDEAKKYYAENQLTNVQYIKLALETCNSESFQDSVSKHKQSIDDLKSEAEAKLSNLLKVRKDLNESHSSFKKMYANFKAALSKKYTAEFVRKIDEEVIPIEVGKTMWAIFNDQIKPEYSEVKNSLMSGECYDRVDRFHYLKDTLTSNLELMRYMVTDPINQMEYDAIEDRVTQLTDLAKRRLSDCEEYLFYENPIFEI